MWGQMLGANGFLQMQTGLRSPDQPGGRNEGFLRTAVGYTLAQDQGFGRAWSPMAEVLIAKPAAGPPNGTSCRRSRSPSASSSTCW